MNIETDAVSIDADAEEEKEDRLGDLVRAGEAMDDAEAGNGAIGQAGDAEREPAPACGGHDAERESTQARGGRHHGEDREHDGVRGGPHGNGDERGPANGGEMRVRRHESRGHAFCTPIRQGR